MEKNYIQLFKVLPETELPDRVFQQVSARIDHAVTLRLRLRSAACATLIVGAAGACISLAYVVSDALDLPAFTQYMSLLTSDSSFVFSHWNEFAITIADSFPLLQVTGISALILVGALSARSLETYWSSLSERKRHIGTLSLS